MAARRAGPDCADAATLPAIPRKELGRGEFVQAKRGETRKQACAALLKFRTRQINALAGGATESGSRQGEASGHHAFEPGPTCGRCRPQVLHDEAPARARGARHPCRRRVRGRRGHPRTRAGDPPRQQRDRRSRVGWGLRARLVSARDGFERRAAQMSCSPRAEASYRTSTRAGANPASISRRS
jgi:hypothetical protein